MLLFVVFVCYVVNGDSFDVRINIAFQIRRITRRHVTAVCGKALNYRRLHIFQIRAGSTVVRNKEFSHGNVLRDFQAVYVKIDYIFPRFHGVRIAGNHCGRDFARRIQEYASSIVERRNARALSDYVVRVVDCAGIFSADSVGLSVCRVAVCNSDRLCIV